MKRFLKMFFCIALLVLLTSAGWADGETFSSETGGTHALSATSDATYTNITVTKTGDVSGQSDDYDWKGTNAAVHASGGAKLVISGSSTNISSNASYGNAVFSYGGNNSNNNNNQGDGTTITISDATITTSKNNSGGIMTTGGGIMNASNLTITTSGGSSAAIRTDSGGGTVTVNGGSYTTNGQGSPAIYSTAAITVTGADLTSNVAQVVVIEGGNSVTLNNSKLTAHHTRKNGQDTTYQAVLIYKSMSKDASSGTSYFTMNGGTLTSTHGAIFHVTNTNTVIALNGVTITNSDSDNENLFLNATSDSWGNSGSNGGTVTLNATDQTINGNMIIDSVSSLNMTLSGTSTFNGAINSSTSSNGSVTVKIESGSTWNMTGNSTVNSLTNNGTIYYGAYNLTVNGTAYNASNPYSGGSGGGSSNDDDDTDDNTDDETTDDYPDVLSIVLKSDGTATYDGTSVTDYGFVWHCDPSSIDEYFTTSSTSTQAYTEDEILDSTGASEEDVYIAHDIRYLTSNANFTGKTATNGMDSEYVAYYDASAVQDLPYYASGTEYIFATLPTQFMCSGGGMPGGGGGMPGGGGGMPGSGDMPGGGGRMPGSGDMPGGPGGTPPSFARDFANSGNVAAFDYMTHTADEAYSNPVLHIQEAGTYKLSGKWHGQIWVDVGKKNKITLILNGVEVSCDVGPAIVFYKAYECEPYDDEAADTAREAAELTATPSFDVEALTIDDAGVIVVLANGKTNKFTGSNTPRMLTTAIKSDASIIDGSDYKQQKKRYKLDGAFHSTRSMVISGDGALSVTSTTSEGLDTEMHLTIIGGSIDVTAPDDGINVNEDYVSVFTFDCEDPSGGSLSVTSTGADGIDSNGYVILKSGTLRIYTANQDGAEGAIDSLDELGSNGNFVESDTSILDYQWGSYSGGSGGGTQPGGDFPSQPGSGDVPGGSGGNSGGETSSDTTLKITTVNVSDAAVNSTYNFSIRVEGSGALTWSASGLPSGLSINSSTGQITGTPTTTGTYNFVVTVTDSTGASASQNFTMTVNAEGSAVAPVIIKKDLPEGAVGYAYYDEISATGTNPINWDFYNNTILPEGLSLISSQSVAVISGSPRVSGTYTFELSATNSVSSDHKEFTIKITNSLEAPVITTNRLNPGIVNSNYTATLSATGSAPITWSISNGTLPTGITLNGNNLSGIPTTAGTYDFTVTARNNAGIASKDFTLTINAEGYTPPVSETAPTITTTSLALGMVGEYYSESLEATGSSPITWSVISGVLPDGLELNSSTGLISGYPEASYEYSFTVRATNSAGSAERALSISIYSNNNYPNNSGIYRHSSSGGCNGGFSILGLALVAIFARKKK